MRVAIIGGGPGGLLTAYFVERRTPYPCTITLFEASHRLGGKIVTGQFSKAPIAYEAGAAELYDYTQLGPDPLRQLITDFGLPTTPMAGETVVLHERILRSDADIGRAFGEDSWKALRKFSRKARAAISPAEYYESDWKEDNGDPLMHDSFQALLAQVPDEIARRYIEVAVHSDLATEPEHTSAMYGLQNYLMNEPDYMRLYTIDGGIERLPRELAKRISAEVRLNQPVVRVEHIANDEYRLFSRRGGEMVSEDFDFVVVALPNNWIPAIEWAGPVLADAMRRHHAHYDYPAHYLRVSILFDRPFWRDEIAGSYFMLDAFGGCCVYDESARNGAGRHGVLGWLLAGEAAVTLSNFDDAALFDKVLDSLPGCLQHGRACFLEGRVHRWLGSVNGLPAGRPVREPDSRHVPEPEQHPWLFVVGDYLFDSTLNGVVDSADVVAEWIVEEIADYLLSLSNATATSANGEVPLGTISPDSITMPEAANGKAAGAGKDLHTAAQSGQVSLHPRPNQ
jgi:monoamine oxidase